MLFLRTMSAAVASALLLPLLRVMRHGGLTKVLGVQLPT